MRNLKTVGKLVVVLVLAFGMYGFLQAKELVGSLFITKALAETPQPPPPPPPPSDSDSCISCGYEFSGDYTESSAGSISSGDSSGSSSGAGSGSSGDMSI